MDLQIEFDESLPNEYHTLAERSLRTAIDFLDNQPRPKGLPEIENYIPNWEEIKFSIGGDTWGHGLFSAQTMKGWCIINVRTDGRCVFDNPGAAAITIDNVDIELATVVSNLGMLDSCYYQDTDWDKQFFIQLKYLDSLAPTDRRARSLLEQAEEAQKEQQHAEWMERYRQQYPEKRRLRLDRQKEAWRIKPVGWYDAKYAPPCKDAPPKFIPAPPPPPQLRETPTPELDQFQQKALAQHKAMLDYVLSNTVSTDTCTTSDPAPVEDGDM